MAHNPQTTYCGSERSTQVLADVTGREAVLSTPLDRKQLRMHPGRRLTPRAWSNWFYRAQRDCACPRPITLSWRSVARRMGRREGGFSEGPSARVGEDGSGAA